MRKVSRFALNTQCLTFLCFFYFLFHTIQSAFYQYMQNGVSPKNYLYMYKKIIYSTIVYKFVEKRIICYNN